MNIFRALKITGNFSITQGFWKNIMVVVGLFGSIIMLSVIFIGGIVNWLTYSLLIIFIVIDSLGLYIPLEYVRSHKDVKNRVNSKE